MHLGLQPARSARELPGLNGPSRKKTPAVGLPDARRPASQRGTGQEAGAEVRQTPFRVNRCLMGALVPATRDGRGAITLGEPMAERLDPGNVATRLRPTMTQQDIDSMCKALRKEGWTWSQTSFCVALLRNQVAAERERCAKLAELHSRLTWNDDRKAQSIVLAAEIRRT